MATNARIERPLSTEALFDRYHVGWETKDPDLIASLHSEDTVFALRDGTLPSGVAAAVRWPRVRSSARRRWTRALPTPRISRAYSTVFSA